MGANNPGINIFANMPPDPEKGTGRVFWVGNNSTYVPGGVAGSDTAGAAGDDMQHPFATLDYAHNQCSANRGDTIYILPGHAETLSAAATFDLAGVTVIGLGQGLQRPQFTVAFAGDGFTITAADVRIENVYFNEATAAATSNINVAAARAILRRIHMDAGTNDVDTITITADGELPTIEDCSVIVTANGPDSWIKFEGVVDRPVIQRNVIVGSDGTNAYDDGVLDFDSVAVTNPIVKGNVFLGAAVTTTVIANGGNVVGGLYGTNTYAGSATSADNVSEESEVIDRLGTESATDPIGEVLSGTAGITTWKTAAAPATGVSMSEVLRDIWDVLRNGTGGAEPGTNSSIVDILSGAGGIITYPAAAAPANAVSIAQAVRAIYNAVAADSGASSTAVQTPLGRRAIKVGDVSSAPDDLFTVTGKCLITLLHGEVTSVIATTTSVAITTSTTVSTIAAATQITTDAAGTVYVVTGDPDDALNGGLAPALGSAFSKTGFHPPFILNDEHILQSIDGAGTGTIQWDLYYIPLEDSASVASTA